MCEIMFNKEVHDKHFIKIHLSRMNMVLKTKQDQIRGMSRIFNNFELTYLDLVL
jgi:hypothetical protein